MIIEEAAPRDPSLLPGYQAEPLFGSHEPRNEIEYDEVCMCIHAPHNSFIITSHHYKQIHHHTTQATGALSTVEDLEERPVSPTELFFDLFFAALLSKVGHNLAEHLSEHPLQVLYFILIFQLIYQNWVQVSLLFLDHCLGLSTSSRNLTFVFVDAGD